MRFAYPSPSWAGLGYILAFGLFQAVLQVGLPGRTYHGPPTPKGNVPVYIANGVQSYVVTLVILGAAWQLGLFDPGAVYDALGSIISTSNLFSLAFCGMLYIKVSLF
jgi:7-dehydrocholesterol reductase